MRSGCLGYLDDLLLGGKKDDVQQGHIALIKDLEYSLGIGLHDMGILNSHK